MTTVTTAGSNGAPEGQGGGAPQDDDPFGYLYRPAEGASGPSAEPQQGVPRTPYSRPMEVGRAQYGQRPQQPPYGQQAGIPPQGYPGGQPQPYPQQAEYGAAPTQQTRYAEHSRPQPGEERPSGGRSKGAVIGAVAVIAAIAIGAGIALSKGDPDGEKNAKGGARTTAPATPSAAASGSPSGTATPSASASATAGPSTVDASQLQAQNAPSGNSVKGAKSADGSYLTLQQGGSVTWTGEVAAAGTYKLTVHFNNAGADVKGAAAVNGKDWPSGLAFRNYSPGKDPAASWYTTWILPQLQAGPNTITITAPSGPILIDQVTVEPSS
ncbi:carbohydrate-binding protein [Kitasatospora sp. NPDC097643]|uniref:carbohydrate-binding protein n=1 Tax=Kitasatospora sp. NPDC097643 TaxID=3157230 RepID=UPI00332FA8A2